MIKEYYLHINHFNDCIYFYFSYSCACYCNLFIVNKAKNQIIRLKRDVETYKKSLPKVLIKNPTKPTRVPSPKAPVKTKFDPCDDCSLMLNS